MRTLVVVAVCALPMAWERAAQQAVFRAGADAVALDVSVTLRNRPVTGLTGTDFELTDNGVHQTILDVGRESTPIDVTFVLDVGDNRGSNSTFTAALVTAAATVRDALHPGDRMSLITFDERVKEWAPLGPPVAIDDALLLKVDAVQVRTRHAALYDALALALAKAPVLDRRHMTILCASGPDGASVSSAQEVLDVARHASMPVFAIGSTWDPELGRAQRDGNTTRMIIGLPAHPPIAFMTQLADETGGLLQVLEPEVWAERGRTAKALHASDAPLSRPFLRALDEFRSSYTLRYIPQGVSRAGWHELKVSVTKPGVSYQVRARKGYAGQPPGPDAGGHRSHEATPPGTRRNNK